MSFSNNRASGGGASAIRVMWAYQDFTAGEIAGTNVTLIKNENGTTPPFVVGNIVGASASLFRQDGESYPYTGATRLFSSRVTVIAHSSDSITLSGIPHVSWGALRIWYQISGVIPSNYTLPSLTVQGEVLTELGAIFEEQENKDTDGTLSANSDIKYPSQKAVRTYVSSLISGVSSVFGRSGEVIAQAGDYTKSDVGLGNVDNTSDAGKPVSTATQTALDLKIGKTTAGEISVLATKSPIVDADVILGENSATSFSKIKILMSSIFTYISTKSGTFTNKTLTSPFIPTAYTATTASAANMFVTSTGVLQRSISGLIWKLDINPYTKGLSHLLTLLPKTYRHKDDPLNTIHAGFIAEDVHNAGMSEFVVYDEASVPDALHYPHMLALVVNAIKDLNSAKDATGGYAGLTLFKINFKNTEGTVKSFFVNANTASRTYTFQDRDGTIADIAYVDNASSNASVISKVLTGFSAGAGTVSTADTILQAFQKIVGNISALGGASVSSVFGRTGAVTAQVGDYTKSDVGLGNVNNTSDAAKPVSAAQQTAIDTKQNTLTAANFGAFSNALTAKATPVDADLFNIADSAASYVQKKTTWANIKFTQKAYFDTLYPVAAGTSAVYEMTAGWTPVINTDINLWSASVSYNTLGGTGVTSNGTTFTFSAGIWQIQFHFKVIGLATTAYPFFKFVDAANTSAYGPATSNVMGSGVPSESSKPTMTATIDATSGSKAVKIRCYANNPAATLEQSNTYLYALRVR